ncbi:MAG: thiamine phosphate synthase [Aphanothece saxicola GSE-SYN-MK-01-06B]|nr:thiamine phosphate synthase [Aphanothece saxicola GSE-SYN-MK-01-06B]
MAAPPQPLRPDGPLPYPGVLTRPGPVTPQPPVPPSPLGSERAAIERLLDANLDRAREGLRVLEDWARFALDRPDLVARSKDLRQRLGRRHQERYKLARHTASDPAAGMSHPAQAERQNGASILAANAGRVQEALRVLEEFGRMEDPALAAEAAAIRYALYDLEVDLIQAGRGGDERRALLRRCHLYLVTSPVEGLEAVVAAGLAAGLRLVQYRAKAGDVPDDRCRFAQASALRQLCHRHGALFLVNDRIDLALAVGADGVHLGQGDLPPAVARRLLGPERLIGRSTHGLEDLRQAVADGCDYVGVGPVEATPTKPGREPVGLAYVSQAAAECPLPFFAIGGIDLANLAAVRLAGAERVAVVRAITRAEDPGAAAAALLAELGAAS